MQPAPAQALHPSIQQLLQSHQLQGLSFGSTVPGGQAFSLAATTTGFPLGAPSTVTRLDDAGALQFLAAATQQQPAFALQPPPKIEGLVDPLRSLAGTPSVLPSGLDAWKALGVQQQVSGSLPISLPEQLPVASHRAQPTATVRSSDSRSSSAYASRHQAAEQRRRTRINERLDALRKLVPHAERSNTACFLEEVIKYIIALKDRNEKLEAAWNAVKDGKGLPGLPPPDPVLLQQPPPPPAAGTTPSNAAPSVKLGADVLATLTAQHQQQQQLLMQQTGVPQAQQQSAQQQPVDTFSQQQLQQALAAQVAQQMAATGQATQQGQQQQPPQQPQQQQQQQPTGSNTVPLHHLLQGSGLQALLQGQGLQQLQPSLQTPQQQQQPPQQLPQQPQAPASVQALPGNNGMVVLQVPLSQLQLPPGLSPQQQQQLLLGQALLSMQQGGQQPQGGAQLVITPSTAAPAATTTTTATNASGGVAAGGGTNGDASTAAPGQTTLSIPGQFHKGPVLTFNEDLFASKGTTGQGVGQLQVTTVNGGGTLLTFPAGMPTASIQIALHQALSGSAGAVGGGGMAPTTSDANVMAPQPAATSISSPPMGGIAVPAGSGAANGGGQLAPGGTAMVPAGAGGVSDVAAAILSALQAQGGNGAVQVTLDAGQGMVPPQQQQQQPPHSQENGMKSEGGDDGDGDGSLDGSESSEGGAGVKRKRA